MRRAGKDVDALYYILQIGDAFMPGDEFYDAEIDKWLPITGGTTGAGFLGDEPDLWDDEIYAPVRRRNPDRLRGRLVQAHSHDFLNLYTIVEIPYGATLEQFQNDWKQVKEDADILETYNQATILAGMQDKGWVLKAVDVIEVEHLR